MKSILFRDWQKMYGDVHHIAHAHIKRIMCRTWQVSTEWHLRGRLAFFRRSELNLLSTGVSSGSVSVEMRIATLFIATPGDFHT